MPTKGYVLLTTGSDYVEKWKVAIAWCGGWPSPDNPNPFFPDDKALRKVFLENVWPELLREELEQKYSRTLNDMRKSFKILYDNNYSVIRAAAAVSGNNDIFQLD